MKVENGYYPMFFKGEFSDKLLLDMEGILLQTISVSGFKTDEDWEHIDFVITKHNGNFYIEPVDTGEEYFKYVMYAKRIINCKRVVVTPNDYIRKEECDDGSIEFYGMDLNKSEIS